MTITDFPARLKTFALVLILAVIVAGCAEVRQGVSWPALDTVSMNGETYLLVAFNEQVDLVNLQNGRVADAPQGGNEAGDWVISGADFENAQFFTAPLALTEDDEATLLFPTYNNKLLEFELETARPVNSAGVPLASGVIARPLMTEELIYIPYRGGGLAALDTETYAEQWRLFTREGVWAAPLLVDGVLYVSSIDHLLYAADAETGQQLWTVDLEGAIASTPLYHDGFLYVGSYSHKLYKIDLEGQIRAEYTANNWIWGTPAVAGDVLYVADLSGNVHAVSTDDLSLVWTAKPANRGIRPGPLVFGDYVIVASRNGTVYWLDREDGEVVYEQEIEGRPELLSDLLLLEEGIAGDDEPLVIVGSTDPNKLVIAFEAETSRPFWAYDR